MSIQSILRQSQIKEMLDYDIVQNRRVFDNQVKQVSAMNEVAAQPKRSDIEFEASVKQRVDDIILSYQDLTNQVGNVTNISRGPAGTAVSGPSSGGPPGLPPTAPLGRPEESESKGEESVLKEAKGKLITMIGKKLPELEKQHKELNKEDKKYMNIIKASMEKEKKFMENENAKKQGLPLPHGNIRKSAQFMPRWKDAMQKLVDNNKIRLNIIKERDDLSDKYNELQDRIPDLEKAKIIQSLKSYDNFEKIELDAAKKLNEKLKTDVSDLISVSNKSGDETKSQELEDEFDIWEASMDEWVEYAIEQGGEFTEAEIATVERFPEPPEPFEFDAPESGAIETKEAVEEEEAVGEGGMIRKLYLNRMQGGRVGREANISQIRSIDKINSAISSIYSKFNALVDFINTKINSAGYSDQQRNNIYSMLEPLVGVSKDALLNVYNIKDIDRSLYNRAYNLLYEIIQNIQNAPPLMRLDITKIRDSHYVADDPTTYEEFLDSRKIYNDLLDRYEGDDAFKSTARIVTGVSQTLAPELEAQAIQEDIEKLQNDKNNIIMNIVAQSQVRTLTKVQQDAVKRQIEGIDRQISSLQDQKRKFEGFARGKTGRGKSGGRAPINENAAVKAQKVSNARARKQQERFNAEAQNPFGPPTYRGLKPDNSLGTLGAGKKNIKMKKTDFIKEHHNLISMLGKTAKKLKSEATEQLQELSAIDKETAMNLNRVVNGAQMKERAKGKGKKSMKLPVLSFDDKRDDWYL